MNNSLKRRDFIKRVSLAGASIALVNPVFSKAFQPNNAGEIANDYFTISFDAERGIINITRDNGTPLLNGGTCAVNTNTAKRLLNSSYKISAESSVFKDPSGSGKKLRILSQDNNKQLQLETHICLYDNLQAVTIELICKNVSSEDISITSLEPIRVIKDEGGMLRAPDVSKCITNGVMYYNTGMIHQFGTENKKPNSAEDIKGVKSANTVIQSPNETIHSWWNIGLFSGYDKEGIVLGYLENKMSLGQLLITKTGINEISFLAESVYDPPVTLKPGKSISSDRFIINIDDNPYKALENYAAICGKIQNARTQSIINGWCSWFYTLSNVTEDEVIRNTEFAAKHLKQYGLEYIQIDEGYQRWHGDWEGNDRFPHGMKWLADKIKSYGFKAGLWIAPYVISEPTEVFQKHPDWLLKKPDGSIKRVGNWSDENSEYALNENPKRYCLDITHPGAAQWMHNLFDTAANRWGYEMIKIDFVAWSILAAERYHDPAVSSAQVYRKGYEIMRNAVGDKCHLLECGPGNTTVGLIDSMRIEADIYYGYNEAAWKTYFLDPASSASAAAKRYYFHKRTWANDVDHLCMDLMTSQQSEAAAAIIALSGGNMISGDRLIQLDDNKIEILKKTTPSYGEAAVPVDLFDSNVQSVFALKVKKPFGEWTVAGFFNESLTEKIEKKFSLERLWLKPGKEYIAFDFWKQQFFGELKDEIKVTVDPGSVTLLAIHEKSGTPQLISTDRHISQGAIEIEDVKWNESTKIFSGISTGPINSSHNIYIYVPESHEWTWGGHILFHDYDSYSIRSVDRHIVRVNVQFDKSEKVKWQINYEEFFK